jgi:hypothetical protein
MHQPHITTVSINLLDVDKAQSVLRNHWLVATRHVELGKPKEVAVKVDVIVSHLDLPVSKRVNSRLTEELRHPTAY